MDIEDFLAGYSGKATPVIRHLHDTLMSLPGVISKVRYKLPFYYRKSWICYLNPLKNGNIELAFTRGNELTNEKGLLDPKGRKQVYGLEIHSLEQVNEEVMSIVQEALLLDEAVPYASKRSK